MFETEISMITYVLIKITFNARSALTYTHVFINSGYLRAWADGQEARPRMLSVCDVTSVTCGTMSVLMTTSGQQHPILIVFKVFSSLAITRMFPGSH